MTPSATERAPSAPLAPRALLRYDVVSRLLDQIRPETILEIGCGQGAFGARLAGRATYVGVEPDPTSYGVARPRIEAAGGTLINGTDADVPDGATSDLVCAFEVLEHLRDDEAALAAWVARVRPGGYLMLSVPAFQERFGPMDVHAGHYRRYSPDAVAALMRDQGLSEVEVVVYGWPLGYLLELVRNRRDARTLPDDHAAPIEDLTAASGRIMQPSSRLSGAVIAAGTLPFRLLQRLRPRAGVGLVALGQRPA